MPRRCSSAATTRTRSGDSGCPVPARCVVRPSSYATSIVLLLGAGRLRRGGLGGGLRAGLLAVDRRDQRLHVVGRLRAGLEVRQQLLVRRLRLVVLLRALIALAQTVEDLRVLLGEVG